MLKHRPLAILLVLALGSVGACTSDTRPGGGTPGPAAPVSTELEECPAVAGAPRTPTREDLQGMEVQELVVCRRTNPSTGDPDRDQYTLEKAVRVGPAEGAEIVRLLAEGERVGAAGCVLIDSPPPVLDAVRVTDAAGDVWGVEVPQPDCVGYHLAGGPRLQALNVSGAIADVLYPD